MPMELQVQSYDDAPAAREDIFDEQGTWHAKTLLITRFECMFMCVMDVLNCFNVDHNHVDHVREVNFNVEYRTPSKKKYILKAIIYI